MIHDVSCVKGLKYNLIGISQFYDNKYKINFQEDRFTGRNRAGTQFFSERRHGNLYLLDIILTISSGLYI